MAGIIKKPIPSFEWEITTRCNYSCSYCFLENLTGKRHCSDATIAAVFKLLPRLNKSWVIKLIGGEPLIHPRITDICKQIIKNGHKLCFATNFSPPLSFFKKLIDICGDRLCYVCASLHLEEVKKIDAFLDKACKFNAIKKAATNFTVTSLVLEENFEKVNKIREIFKGRGLIFDFQSRLVNRRFLRYNAGVERGILGKLNDNEERIRGANFFGKPCYAGKYFFKIAVNGDVVRCYDEQVLYYNLGNIANGTFRALKGVKPCLSKKCTCPVPSGKSMICAKEKTGKNTLMALRSDLLKYLKGRADKFAS